jgi:hypothetical protein
VTLAALLVVLATQGVPDSLGARILESARAAQALQGPLDGAWLLTGADGRMLYRLRIADPADGGPIGLAWSDPAGATGVAVAVRRSPNGLKTSFGRAGPWLELREVGARWRGRLRIDGRIQSVRLSRNSG